jgi:maltoporin
MKLNPRALLPALLMAAGISFAAGAAATRVGAQGTVSDPVLLKTPKPNKKPLKFVGLVISANAASLTARSDSNASLLQTFSYSPGVRAQMVKILNKGGYQYGDKVRVEYAPGTTVALSLKGKASKPRKFTTPATK